jgi:hypothetical protein
MRFNIQLAQSQLRHRLRFGGQMLSPPRQAIVGAYHYENLGDMALAEVGRAYWPGGARPALQTSANIAKWPGRPVTLVCGGAILTEDFVAQMRLRFGDAPHRLAMIGVEFSNNAAPLSKDSLNFLSRLPYVSLRNREQLPMLGSGGMDEDGRLVPDIVFGLPGGTPGPGPEQATRPRFGVNITGGTGRDRQMSAAEADNVRCVQRQFFRTVVANAADRGWDVEHVPFAINDDAAARRMLEGLPVLYARFSCDPASVRVRLASMAGFAPSRYHALIFAVRAGLPVTPFFYARKNYWLASDFLPGLPPFGFREALAGASDDTIRGFAERSYLSPEGHLARLQDRVASGFSAAFAAICRR